MARIEYNVLDDPGLQYTLNMIRYHLTMYLASKVDKEDGYGLSQNDFTDLLKAKLDGIAEGATKVIIDAAMSSSSENPVQNKVIYEALQLLAPLSSPNFVGIPTAPTAGLGTDNTQIATTAYTLAAINNALADFTSVKFEFPEDGVLPETGKVGTFYFIPHDDVSVHDTISSVSTTTSTTVNLGNLSKNRTWFKLNPTAYGDGVILIDPYVSAKFTGIGDDSTINHAVNLTVYLSDCTTSTSAFVFTTTESGEDKNDASCAFEISTLDTTIGTFEMVIYVQNIESEMNYYDEYVWTGNKYEFLGSTSADMSDYVKYSDISTITTSEIDAMFANW